MREKFLKLLNFTLNTQLKLDLESYSFIGIKLHFLSFVSLAYECTCICVVARFLHCLLEFLNVQTDPLEKCVEQEKYF